MKSSLIIATYNWPQALHLCLQSVTLQKQLPTEVIIADDGSTQATKEVIDEFRKILPIPIKHIWHPDEGFKLAQIRNKAAANAFEYIIQIDGDLILHPQFVKDHLTAAKTNNYICGSRVILNKKLTQNLLEKKVVKTFHFFSKNILNRFNTIYFTRLSNFINKYRTYKNITSIRGCNMSYWKSDFIDVNGYNEAYQGWGREDSDLVYRFSQKGMKRCYFKFRGIVYHLYHKENDRSLLEKNDALLQQTLQQKEYKCNNGISQYL